MPATAMELHVSLAGRTELTVEIYRQLRQAILDGRLPSGERLPATRKLAHRLGVSRTTVAAAYDRLAGEGVVTARVGAGTFVSNDVPELASQTKPARRGLRPRALWDATAIPAVLEPQAEFDFGIGIPDARLFPYPQWRRLLGQQLHPAADLGGYGDPAGHPGLRAAIARHLAMARAVKADVEDVVVTSGTQQALDLVARVLLGPGDQVAVEDPGYGPLRRLLASLGARVAGVPVDDQGLVVEAIPARTRLVCVTPSHQLPLGVTMSLGRRLALLAWARRHDAAIVEDDYDSVFRYAGRPVEPLQALDPTGQVIYVGSFSTILLPTLHLGFVVVPASLRTAVRAAKYVADLHSPLPMQAALAGFIDQGLLARHIRKMRAVYAQRHQLVTDGLRRRFAEHLQVVPSTVGLHVTATAPTLSAGQLEQVLRRASAAGVVARPLAMYGVDGSGPAGLVVGYGAIPTERVGEGLRRLRECFHDH